MNPIIAHLKNARRDISRAHTTTPETELRVPMTRAQLDHIIASLEDSDYYKSAIETICDQVEQVKVELDKIEDAAESLFDKKKTFAENATTLGILQRIKEIREFYGMLGGLDDEDDQPDVNGLPNKSRRESNRGESYE